MASARSTGESAPAAIVMLRFRNHSADALDVRAYRLSWPGGSLTAKPGDLRLPAEVEVERTVRVETRHGDVASLIDRSAEARVEVTDVVRS